MPGAAPRKWHRARVREVPGNQGLAAAPSALEGQVWDRYFLLLPEFACQVLRGRAEVNLELPRAALVWCVGRSHREQTAELAMSSN